MNEEQKEMYIIHIRYINKESLRKEYIKTLFFIDSEASLFQRKAVKNELENNRRKNNERKNSKNYQKSSRAEYGKADSENPD